MISLNDYLYSGHTVLSILHQYEADLRASARKTGSIVDQAHCNFLLQLTGLLEHNDFLTLQSQHIREFYFHMTRKYPRLAFTFRGRIKSLIRAEGKFNGYVIEYISEYYKKYGVIPSMSQVREKLGVFRDLIAYRFVISMPKCNVPKGTDLEKVELAYLYEIANELPAFLEEQGFTPQLSGKQEDEEAMKNSPLAPAVRPYYRDYVAAAKSMGYRSLHITFFDNIARCYVEVQLRTKEMDDNATIGEANHSGYEDRQRGDRAIRESVPEGLCEAFDQALERYMLLQQIDFAELDVNMFRAYSMELMNDGCGLFRGRLITPFEHLSRYQND